MPPAYRGPSTPAAPRAGRFLLTREISKILVLHSERCQILHTLSFQQLLGTFPNLETFPKFGNVFGNVFGNDFDTWSQIAGGHGHAAMGHAGTFRGHA